ncbi:MAG: tripartite tricarboxylate transporter substrate binding protein [Gammaproteobacteria bacterium]|jgi:tripartite-type tricarboxylate transporter receptor subunit TctC|nr:tripartite tricarboxylate transporter substrate binding protein [Gammaproteobacteria bacterium]MBU0785302.1 tripartite tricarboxylate transporter substrate binding protein [Gammaproteobacteria bacterium]MBU0815885.1 tripartite tricarboxylate transporter substrate binding protein [Gammaproteobacteria bacterium]MBU1787424.1 tripartite tricarboxylate transporter substrate binding protein [Gammaproteobacteria bacterium]
MKNPANPETPALSRRQILAGAAALAAPAIVSSSAFAQDKFPSRPITLIAPWPAGGSSDGVMRAFAESAGRVLGVPVVIENKPGVGGTLGASAMMQAKPDGYTLTQLPLGIYRLPHMQKMAFDPVKDLTHIVCLTGYTFGLAATMDAPYKTLKEMVAYAKANPGKVAYGHTGTGTTPHLAVEEFSAKAGIQLQDIPYKGSAEIMQAILGGHIPMMSGTTEFAPHVKAGKLRLLATLGRERNKAFADVPTVKESGWDTISESPFGMGGPKGMDPAVVRTLHDAFKKTLEDPKVQEALDRFYMPTIYMNTADYTAYAERTFASEKATIERLGLARKG